MKDAKGHGSEKRPIAGHPYHAKSDMELRYIQKDAHEAGRNAQEMGDQRGVNKYADQVNDAATVLAYRARGGKSDAPSDQLHSGTSKSDLAPVHDSMAGADKDIARAYLNKDVRDRDAQSPGQGYHYFASGRGGKTLGKGGPHPDRETAARAGWSAHPNAKQVSTSRGAYGMDVQWHRKS